ncbi:DUF3833 family protein [Pseudoprimorskyibacter insulae]|uniref:DUF3833 domain-containing protein n=1 Tax=Pseudoprimorskyibacter insulae TaxID=1695997 RepID=A0A2R8AUF2_9RHOB|nr:DUF3833 family protein [Pseudoprimorskyibacter insulae]SPF79668.1 hypothetical protein PRI8871_01465 [Pseudoprimorskyibacter insulae]
MTLLWIALGAGMMLAAFAAFGRFAGFHAQRPEDYAKTGQAIDLRRDLSGPILCEGVIYGPTGRVVSRFVGDFHARWNGNHGIMEERFAYDSGRSQTRVWQLHLNDDGTLQAAADDLVGAGQGRQSGSAACLNYRIRLEEDAGGHVLNVRDWMYLAPNGTIVNRSQFRKYGLKVGELVATMRRKEVA